MKLHEEIKRLEAKINRPLTEQETDRLTALLNRRDEDLWLSMPARRPAGHDAFVADIEHSRKRILSIINLKGGVAKTTIAANLAAYFDKVHQKKVLLIDADYQGSLSDIMLRKGRESTAKVDEWLSSDVNPGLLIRTANPAGSHLPNTSYVTAFYSLASIETKLMIAWLLETIRDGTAHDLRFTLSRILFSEEARRLFDVVIIDCPPRLSTATVNAICASTHIVVPSIPDHTSLEAVRNFEPHRVCRRLPFLRRWSNEQTEDKTYVFA